MNFCEDCALRLVNDTPCNVKGVGNAWSGNTLVLPNVYYNAYRIQNRSFSSQVDKISTIFSTGGGFEQNLYIIPLVRCNNNKGIEIDENIVNKCTPLLFKDIEIHNVKNIMLCGQSAKYILGITDISNYIDTIIYDKKKERCYFVNYSPANRILFDKFKTNLLKFYNAVTERNYKNYKLLFI